MKDKSLRYFIMSFFGITISYEMYRYMGKTLNDSVIKAPVYRNWEKYKSKHKKHKRLLIFGRESLKSSLKFKKIIPPGM